jgi:hypothetical protein
MTLCMNNFDKINSSHGITKSVDPTQVGIDDLPLIEVSKNTLNKQSSIFVRGATDVELILRAYIDQVKAYYPDPPVDTSFANWAFKA